MGEVRRTKIKGRAEQYLEISDYSGTDWVADGDEHVFIRDFQRKDQGGLVLGAYVNREKFLKKIAKFFNVVIYDVGYLEHVVGEPTDTVEFEQSDVGYHRYTEED